MKAHLNSSLTTLNLFIFEVRRGGIEKGKRKGRGIGKEKGKNKGREGGEREEGKSG